MSEEKNYIAAFKLSKKLFYREKEDLHFCEKCRTQHEEFINVCEECGHIMNSQMKLVKSYEEFKQHATTSILIVAKTNQVKANEIVDELTEVTTELANEILK